MVENRDRSMTATHEHSSRIASSSSVSGRRSSRASVQARQALRLHAQMFEALGMELVREEPDSLALEGERSSLQLEYEVDKKILARIYHLRAKSEVTSNTPSSVPRYQINFKARGIVEVSYGMVSTGSGSDEGQSLADHINASGLVSELVQKMDLEALSIVWDPQRNLWEVSLGPYPGAHVQTIFPPMAYTVRLRDSEVRDIYGTLVTLTAMLDELDRARPVS